jgi:putative membrane protein
MLTFRENRELHYLLAGTAAAVGLSAYRPSMLFDWWLENLLVFLMFLFLAATYRRIPLSTFAYAMILGFLLIHEWGAHHKYADVPLGEWMKGWLNTRRNHYDRVSHFAFGFFLSVPLREAFVATSGHRGPWSYFVPVEFALAAGAIYECIEAAVAEIVTPEQGEAFVGMQGDMWDAQKDIALGGAGAAVMMLTLWLRRMRQRRSRRCMVLQSDEN